MLGTVDGSVKIGEQDFEMLTKQQVVRRQQKAIVSHVLCSGSVFKSSDMMVLTVLLATVTAGQSARVEQPYEEPMSLSATWMVGVAFLMFGFLVVCVVAMMSNSPRQRELPEEEEVEVQMMNESETETND